MKYIHHDLGQCRGGEIVEIMLRGNAANVQLMSSSDFSNYRAGRNYRYIGGLAKRSPVRLQVPRAGRWHVAVDMRGMRGSVRSSARILPSALPPLREAPLSSVPSLVQPEPPLGLGYSSREYDVFISHASEDKDSIVRALADALVAENLRVWYDEFELRIGDSLRRKIDLGLAKSRVGLVVLSKSFMSKGWTNYELDGIVTRSVTGEQIMLPIWHEVTKNEVIAFSPSLADKVARSTATHTVEEIAEEIAELIRTHTA
ncbi:DUF1883 domain-containing protein [bacterium]|nr:DUF1883 domain-containing protein [bacterium]